MTNYNDGQWHGWNGGECPVHPKTEVEAVVRPAPAGGDEYKPAIPSIAGRIHWGADTLYPIIAFRVTKEHREPREWWINEKHQTFHKYKHDDECIHVREVLDE